MAGVQWSVRQSVGFGSDEMRSLKSPSRFCCKRLKTRGTLDAGVRPRAPKMKRGKFAFKMSSPTMLNITHNIVAVAPPG